MLKKQTETQIETFFCSLLLYLQQFYKLFYLIHTYLQKKVACLYQCQATRSRTAKEAYTLRRHTIKKEVVTQRADAYTSATGSSSIDNTLCSLLDSDFCF